MIKIKIIHIESGKLSLWDCLYLFFFVLLLCFYTVHFVILQHKKTRLVVLSLTFVYMDGVRFMDIRTSILCLSKTNKRK